MMGRLLLSLPRPSDECEAREGREESGALELKVEEVLAKDEDE